MSTIRKAIEGLDPAKDIEAVIKEQLETLIELADKNAQLDEERIINSLKDGKINDDLRIPITKTIASKREARAVTSQSSSAIVAEIAKSVESFFNPGKSEILNGVAGILGTAMDALMGSGEGTEMKQNLYLVAVEYPAIVRLDFAIWVRNTRAKGISTRCKNAISVVAYKSAVDVSKLDYNTFIAVYAPILQKAFGSNYTEIDKMLDKSKEIYEKYVTSKNSENQLKEFSFKNGNIKPFTINQLMTEPEKKIVNDF